MVDSPSGSELREIRAAPPARALTFLTVLHGWPADAERWLLSVFAHHGGHDFEALLVDNSGDARVVALERRAAERVRWVRLDPPLGFGEAVNAGLQAAAGEVVVLCDPGVEFAGDAAGALLAALAEPEVKVAGPFGVRGRGTLKEFGEHPGPEVDAVEGYCMAFRRAEALAAGGFDPRFRFYRMADIEFSFRLRSSGGRALVLPGLPVRKHAHRLWEATEPKERNRLSKKNLYRFLDRWRDREDLLTR